jgi:hypothetical protein
MSRTIANHSSLLLNSNEDVLNLYKKFSTSWHFVSDATKVGIFVGLGKPQLPSLSSVQLQLVSDLLCCDCSDAQMFAYDRAIIQKQVFGTFSYCARYKRDNSAVVLNNGLIGRILLCLVVIKNCVCGLNECICNKQVAVIVECFGCRPGKCIYDKFVEYNLAELMMNVDDSRMSTVAVKPESISEKCVIVKDLLGKYFAIKAPKYEVQ